MPNISRLEDYYRQNSQLPGALKRPRSVYKETKVNSLPTLFATSRYLDYANPGLRRMRGAPAIPGPEAAQYGVNPSEPSDEELLRRGEEAWNPDYVQRANKEKCNCVSRESLAKQDQDKMNSKTLKL